MAAPPANSDMPHAHARERAAWLSTGLLTVAVGAGVGLPAPGYQAWAIVAATSLLALVWFVVDGIITRNNRIPAQPFQWILLALATILAGHLASDHLHLTPRTGLHGGLNASMLFHFALIAAGIMLTQRVAQAKRPGAVFVNITAAMLLIGGGIGAIGSQPPMIRELLWLLSAGGLCLWLAPCACHPPNHRQPSRRAAAGRFALAGLGAAMLLFAGSVLLWSIALGCAILIGLCWLLARSRCGVLWSWLVAGATTAALIAGWAYINPDAVPLESFGRGERGFARVFGGSDGASILAATTGLAGLAILLGGTIALGAFALRRTHRTAPHQLRQASLWFGATLLLTMAWLLPGGFTSPAAAAGLIVAWGFAGRLGNLAPGPQRPGWILLAATAGLIFLTAIAGDSGLMINVGIVYGLGDKAGHLFVGFVVSLLAAWLCARKSWWLGLVALLVAALAGGVGELAQKLLSSRGVDMADWHAHLAGSLMALAVFSLGLIGRGATTREKKPWGISSPKRSLGIAAQLLLGSAIGLISARCAIEALRLGEKRSRTEAPWFVVSDALVSPIEKSFYLPGTTNSPTAAFSLSVVTIQHNPLVIERGWCPRERNVSRMYPRITTVMSGRNAVIFQGAPYSELAYERKLDARIVGIPHSQSVVLIDARDITPTLGPIAHSLPIAFVHPGPLHAYLVRRAELRKIWPNVPCLCDVTLESGAKQTAYSIYRSLWRRGHPLLKTHLITSDPTLAKAFAPHFGGALSVTILSSPASLRAALSAIVDTAPAHTP